ncbi:hypothetical protein Scep_015386 [Stephania cephalantha]|uniref:Uncharacterized protein n=1 Tax=Stephania cephalantha TaxID=152367 RepID=A0AAP0J4I3_9MAGN
MVSATCLEPIGRECCRSADVSPSDWPNRHVMTRCGLVSTPCGAWEAVKNRASSCEDLGACVDAHPEANRWTAVRGEEMVDTLCVLLADVARRDWWSVSIMWRLLIGGEKMGDVLLC